MSEREYSRSYFEEGNTRATGKWKTRPNAGILEVLSLVPPELTGKALDIGCAYGYGLEVLDGLGFEPFGMDISEYAIGRARERTDAKVAAGDVQEFIPFDGKFDLVTCVDTLEHLECPEEAIANMYEKLRKEGFFVASTPNKDWWKRKIGLHNEQETHSSVRTADEWEETLRALEWSELEVWALQTVPVIWRVLDYPVKFHFPWGEIVRIKGMK